MTNFKTSDTELGARCMDVLIREVGMVEAERFIAYVNREKMDYTKWQQGLFAGMSLEEIADGARNAGTLVMPLIRGKVI